MQVIVIGAGAFGLGAALALRARGHAVTVLETGPFPRELAASTDVSKVVRMDYGADALHGELAAQALVGWRQWNQRGRRLFHEDGFLVLATAPLRAGSFEHASCAWLTARGVGVERLDDRAIARRHPAFARCVDGYFNPEAGWVESAAALRAFADRAVQAGVELRTDAAVLALRERGSRVVGVATARGELHADVVVVAAGAWTPVLLPELGSFLRVTGQPVVHLQAEEPQRFQPPQLPVWAVDIATSGWYGFPALADGTLKIGNHGPGRPVHPDEPRLVLADELERCRAFVAATLPALAAAPVARTRLCLYCDSADGDFLIDRHPDRPGLVVAAGDSGHGFKFAPVLGDVVADAVEQRRSEFTARFAFRAPDRGRREAARSS